MHIGHLPRALGRCAPLAAALIGSAALAAPAGAQAPVGGPVVPFVGITANTAEIIAEGLSPADVTVTRNGATLATGAFVDSTDGAFTVNSAEIAAAGLPIGCWASFTPQLLPGDVVSVAGERPVTIPAVTAEAPQQVGDSVVVHGTAVNVDPAMPLSVQIWAAGGRFVNPRIGLSGGQFIDTSGASPGTTASLTFDAANPTHWTAKFSNLGGNLPFAAGGTAVAASASPDVVGAGTLFSVDYQAGGVAAGQANCPAYAPDEARSVSRSLITTANAGSDLTVNGVAHPGASLTAITLTDSTGKVITAPALGGAIWSANVPSASLAGLADGPISIGTALATFGKGATATGLLSKDTTAPSAVTASVPSGQYPSTQNVALRSSDGTIHYTTDGSDPSASSKTYTGAISVAQTGPVKAIAIDGAGNASDISRFDYVIARPVVAPSATPVARLPRLKVESLTLVKRMGLRSARKRGIDAIIYAPEGAKIAHIRILKGAKVVQTINRKVSRDGVLELRMPTTKKTRKALKRGSYRIEIQLGQNLSNLGAKLVRNVKLV
jgi:Chitobiase/beta-hexosaminidase C-terminal domain